MTGPHRPPGVRCSQARPDSKGAGAYGALEGLGWGGAGAEEGFVTRVTAEQTAIVDAVAERQSVRVIALAGTGKTTTLGLAARALPRRPTLYVAFNRSVRDAARRRFPAWVEARTAHSLAFAAVGRAYGDRLVPSAFALRRVWPQWAGRRLAAVGLDHAMGLAVVVQTLANFTHSVADTLLAEHVPPLAFAREAPAARARGTAAVLDVGRYFWRQVLDAASDCPITHDMYLKRWQLGRPTLPYEVILFDEAQDADPVILDVIERQAAQLIVVGDPHQAIYGWRGSHNALARWSGLTLPLTTSWRFGPAIADAANQVLDRLGAPHRLSGAGPSVPARGPHAILSRTTMGLLTETAGALRRQERVSVLGGAKPFADLLDGVHALQQGRAAQHPDLALFPTWADLAVTAETPAGAEYRPLVKFVDQNRETLPQVVQLLRQATVPPDRATVVLATAHKAKGQEWATVMCGDDFTWPQFVEDREEAHLIYVAITRAQHVLEGDDLRRTVAAGGPVAQLPHRPRPGAVSRGRRPPPGPAKGQLGKIAPPHRAPATAAPRTQSKLEPGRAAQEVAQDAEWAEFRRWFAARDITPPRRPPEEPP